MARTRYIKPTIGTDEDLALLSIPARYLFAILPTLCDREGRTEDSPRLIKLSTFPWDEIDVEALLCELSPRFITRYEVKNKRFLQVSGFAKHQRPHPSEVKSEIPPPSTRNIISHDKKLEKIGPNEIMSIKGTGTITGTGTCIAVPPVPPVGSKPKTDLQRIVEAYKVAKGVSMEDKGWDRANFARCSKAGKHLLDCFGGDLDKSAAYLFLRSEEMNEKGLEWTLETISRHAWDGMGIPKEENGQQHSKMGAVSLSEPGRNRRLTQAGEIVSETMRAIESTAIRAEGPAQLEADGGDSFNDGTDFS